MIDASASPIGAGVTLFMPVLNEIEGMKVILPQIQRNWYEQILVVDGGSRDGSLEYARDLGFDTHLQRRRGIRHAYIEAWPMIRGELVVTLSPDGNCPPGAIPELITTLKEGYDMVIASRYYGGAKSDDDDLLTSFGNWLFTTSINVLHGGHYTDAMGIYRGYKTSLFKTLDLDREESYSTEKLLGTTMGIEPLLSMRCAKRKLRVCEIGVPEPARIGGERKLQIVRWGGAYMLQNFRELYFWRRETRRSA
jgi:glycosyltransferase involved in cell wall biosynthesis